MKLGGFELHSVLRNHGKCDQATGEPVWNQTIQEVKGMPKRISLYRYESLHANFAAADDFAGYQNETKPTAKISQVDLSHFTRWPHKPEKYRWLFFENWPFDPNWFLATKKSDHLGESSDYKQFLIPKWSPASKMVTASTWCCSSNWAMFKTLTTFHSTDWFIGILIMAYYPPYIS